MQVALATLCLALFLGAGFLTRCPQWVSFDGAPQEAAMAAPLPAERMPAAIMLPVSMGAGHGEVRPMLASAVMEGPARAPEGRILNTVAGPRRRARLRSVRVKALSSGPRSWRATPVRNVAGGALRVAAAATAEQPSALPAAHLVVTEFEVSQPLYAAVPWRGGWLIVQL